MICHMLLMKYLNFSKPKSSEEKNNNRSAKNSNNTSSSTSFSSRQGNKSSEIIIRSTLHLVNMPSTVNSEYLKDIDKLVCVSDF